jgi:LEA14-like dessication related protein
MLRKVALAVLIFTCALLLNSCIQPSPPKAEFVEYKIAAVTLEGIRVNFIYKVKNPNPLGINISSYSYTIHINNQEFLSETRPGFNLDANGTNLIEIPVVIRYDRLFGTAVSVLERIARGDDTISYRIEGKINTKVADIVFGTPFQSSGTIPLPREINLQ